MIHERLGLLMIHDNTWTTDGTASPERYPQTGIQKSMREASPAKSDLISDLIHYDYGMSEAFAWD